MTPLSSPSAEEDRHLLLFDGVCGLCSRLVQFVLAHDRRRAFSFASLQSATGRARVEHSGRNPEDLTTLFVIENYRASGAKVITKARAALFVVAELGGPWRILGLLGVLPTGLLDWCYDLVARHRHRVFGRREECLGPSADDRSRFIDL